MLRTKKGLTTMLQKRRWTHLRVKTRKHARDFANYQTAFVRHAKAWRNEPIRSRAPFQLMLHRFRSLNRLISRSQRATAILTVKSSLGRITQSSKAKTDCQLPPLRSWSMASTSMKRAMQRQFFYATSKATGKNGKLSQRLRAKLYLNRCNALATI